MSEFRLTVPVGAVRGFFGDRLATYSTSVPAADVTSLLGHDPRPQEWKRLPPELHDLYVFIQRKPDKSRRDSVAGYIAERFGPDAMITGAFPAISVAFVDPIAFRPQEGAQNGNFGTAEVPISRNSFRVLIDGLGRVAGALDLEAEGGERSKLLGRFTFPLTIFAPREGTSPLTQTEIGQLFHDFNFRVRPVSRAHALALDTSDPYILLADKLAQLPLFARNGGVAIRVKSLGSKSIELVTQQNLVRCVRGACEGAKFQVSNTETIDDPNLTRETFGSLLDSVAHFFESFAAAMDEKRFADRESVHLSALGWQALGVLHHDIAVVHKAEGARREHLIGELGRIDWSRYNQDWIGLIGDKDPDGPKDALGRSRVRPGASRRQDIESLFNHLRRKIGLVVPSDERRHAEAA